MTTISSYVSLFLSVLFRYRLIVFMLRDIRYG